MTKIKETLLSLKEKTWQFWFRNVLRIIALIVLSVLSFFKILKPYWMGEEVSLTAVDAKIIFGCIALVIAIEAVKALVERITKNLPLK